jgi:hypothetical protein
LSHIKYETCYSNELITDLLIYQGEKKLTGTRMLIAVPLSVGELFGIALRGKHLTVSDAVSTTAVTTVHSLAVHVADCMDAQESGTKRCACNKHRVNPIPYLPAVCFISVGASPTFLVVEGSEALVLSTLLE